MSANVGPTTGRTARRRVVRAKRSTGALRRAPRRRREAGPSSLDTSPSRYVARVDRLTGEEIDGAIHPEELLVHTYRDHHPVDLTVQFLASRLVDLTRERVGGQRRRTQLEPVGAASPPRSARLWHDPSLERRARDLLGVAKRDFTFRFREACPLLRGGGRVPTGHPAAERPAPPWPPRAQAALRVLLTGATGFLGKEVLVQAVEDPQLAELVCLLRPNGPIRRTARVRPGAPPQERGDAASPAPGDPRTARRGSGSSRATWSAPAWAFDAAESPACAAP